MNLTHCFMVWTKKTELPLDQKIHLRLNIKPCYHLIKNTWRNFIAFLETEQSKRVQYNIKACFEFHNIFLYFSPSECSG